MIGIFPLSFLGFYPVVMDSVDYLLTINFQLFKSPGKGTMNSSLGENVSRYPA